MTIFRHGIHTKPSSPSADIVRYSSRGFVLQNRGELQSTVLNMDPSLVDIPPLKDLTIDNVTENVHLINSRCPDPRLKYLLERLVLHVHDFARETRLSTKEWMAGIHFLTKTGQICTDVRQVSALTIHSIHIRPYVQDRQGSDSSLGVHLAVRCHRTILTSRQHRSPETCL